MRRLLAILVFIFATRLLQSDLLWVEEGYPSAAALQLLGGKTLYRDIWFDKPPLFAALYALWGAYTGVALRLAGALFVCACCWLIFKFARRMWTDREGYAAAALLAWFLTFGIPSAVMALAPDLIMVLPHIAAVYLAWRGRPFWSGVVAGLAMLLNTKAAFVLLACLVWQWRAALPLLGGFLLPNALCAAWMFANGSLTHYLDQVWRWGFLYSRDTFVRHPLIEGLVRTANWTGFHAALVLGVAWYLWRDRRWRFAAWVILAFAGVAMGWRFFPRYYFLLLPVFCLLASRTLTSGPTAIRIAMAVALLVPAARFGPRLAWHQRWSDTAMMDDSRQAAAFINQQKSAGDTLLVWGYRPDIFAFTRLPAGSRFLDSQPLTGVIADRHLTSSVAAAPALAAANRRELTQSHPTFIVDGLGPYNPALAIDTYLDLHRWLSGYRLVARTQGCIIYQRIPHDAVSFAYNHEPFVNPIQ